MAGVIQAVEWKESAEGLYKRYCAERDVERRKRLQALWRVRQGETETEAARQAGVGRRTLARWLSWYRSGGLDEVLCRVPGHGAQGKPCRLTASQQEELVERCGRGEFRTTGEVRRWVEHEWGACYRESGMYSVLSRLEIHPRVPRPRAEKADPQVQNAWKKGGVHAL